MRRRAVRARWGGVRAREGVTSRARSLTGGAGLGAPALCSRRRLRLARPSAPGPRRACRPAAKVWAPAYMGFSWGRLLANKIFGAFHVFYSFIRKKGGDDPFTVTHTSLYVVLHEIVSCFS